MIRHLENVVCALVMGLCGCAGSSGDPLPGLTPRDLYDSTVTVGTDEFPARAVLRRHASGDLVFALRGYQAEAAGVRSWEQRAELVLAIAEDPTGDLSLSNPEISGMFLERPLESGLGSPSLTLVIGQDGTFTGELAADVLNADTGGSHRAFAVFAGVLEQVECVPESGSAPVTLGSTVSLACTETELGMTFGAGPSE